MRFFGKTKEASFLSRPNRFVAYCDLDGKRVKTFLPNPGRLQELLFPGVTMLLEEGGPPDRATRFTAVAVLKGDRPVVLHTHKANDAARYLLEQGRIPGLENAEIVRAEVAFGRSRFDFLLRQGGKDLYLEVKSCTFFSRRMAMFPDAVTSRGRRHIEELAALSNGRRRGAVLFLVQNPRADIFLPEYHTDLVFARTLYSVRRRIAVIPLALTWRRDLSLDRRTKLLKVPWEIVKREAEDRGGYLLILHLQKDAKLEVGKLGEIRFKKGFYIYVGSAMAHLSRRIERHRRLRKKKFWHIDYLREACEFHAALPVLSRDDLECEMAKAVQSLAEDGIPGFGSSDCACPSHLFRMAADPLNSPAFHDVLQYFRMERLIGA